MQLNRLVLLSVSLLAFTTLADGSKIQLGAYCPVAYLNAGKALVGDAKFSSDVDGKTFVFIDAGAKKAFDADPQKFVKAIQYDAWCATGMAMGKKLASDPALLSVRDGRVYLFSSKGAKEAFDKAPQDFIGKADAQAKKVLAN